MPKNTKILIIDDMEANRYAFSRYLKQAGYQMTEAATVKDGLAQLESQKPDLLILDVQLPDGNGFNVCTTIKNDPIYASIPVLMTSASFVEARDKAQGLDCGADGYLTTPIDPIELVATVKALLRIRDAERKLTEAYEKAEAANVAKTEFLANMSHEIRTPMNAIIGIARIMAGTSLSPKQQQLISTLQQSSESLMHLINDLLDIAKIEENMIELEATPFSLTEVVERIIGMMREQANNKHIALNYSQEARMPDHFIGDSQRLYQVLLNLVSNAIKFTSIGGVNVTVGLAPSTDPSKKMVIINVQDSGIGITKDKLDLIFQKFTQADSSTTRRYGGSGLGLAIAKRLIEQMGGGITVTSEPDKGSTFTLHVPLKEATGAATARPAKFMPHTPPLLGQQQHGHILLVEDHEPNVLVATLLLESFGYKYRTATNGKQALELLKEHTFDAVLMDVQMQEMDGFEATQRLRQWEKQFNRAPVHVIAMTAHVMQGDRERCLEAGMDDYISKPISETELEKKLAALMRQKESVGA